VAQHSRKECSEDDKSEEEMNAESEDQGRCREAEVKELARQQETMAYSHSPRQPPHSQSLNTNTTGNLAPSALHSTPAAKRR